VLLERVERAHTFSRWLTGTGDDMSMHSERKKRRGAASCRGLALAAALVSALLFQSQVAAESDEPSSRVPGARELEGKLIAPCCWTQTLDIHDSPLAEQLRAEIAQRLRRGEPAANIEDDLAARYGEKIRAVPRGEDPRQALPLLVGGAMSIAAIWLVWLGAAWLSRSRAASNQPSQTAQGADAGYDKQLDHELEQMSDVS
jgi:cytochrome c-type biogenesis protein CcmH